MDGSKKVRFRLTDFGLVEGTRKARETFANLTIETDFDQICFPLVLTILKHLTTYQCEYSTKEGSSIK